MPIAVTLAEPASVQADVLGVPVTEPAVELTGAAAWLDERLGGRLSELASAGEVSGEPGETLVLHLNGDLPARRLATTGVGPRDRVDTDAVRTGAAALARAASSFGGTLAWVLDESLPLSRSEQVRAAVEGAVLGAYDPGRWKTNGTGPRAIERLVLATTEGDGELVSQAERAARIATWANRARDLANAPPNELTPERLAERAHDVAAGATNLEAEALGPDEIASLGMGALAAVAQGSHNPARLIVLRYTPPSARDDVVLGLVGKAITFDTGGISLKPGLKMEDMKGDMAGGAAVVEGMGALAELAVPIHAIAVVAATENMIGGGAYRPGDILRAANGKTIEVVNTDAEGRLVLADALWYARREGATHVLDLATLTGAMEIALGDLYAGLFANDDAWRELIVEAAEASGDHAWPFPLHPRYRRYIDSDFADMKNSSILRQGSPALAAEFLQEFAGEGPWAHIDMAGPGFIERSRGDYLTQRGGTGYGVRLIVELASRLAAR